MFCRALAIYRDCMTTRQELSRRDFVDLLIASAAATAAGCGASSPRGAPDGTAARDAGNGSGAGSVVPGGGSDGRTSPDAPDLDEPETRDAGSDGLVGYLRTNWSKDPYSLGSYSYVSKDSPGTGERDRSIVEAPIDSRIYFAGEALNPLYQSTVHAAHESGLRVAEAVRNAGHKRVAIVGAGMAGLTAAVRLGAVGLDVTVWEARDRIGGRLQTDTSLGVASDLGASWIHGPDGNPLTELADQLGLDRVETDDTYILRGAGGREVGFLGAPSWLEESLNAVAQGVESSELNTAYFSEVFPDRGIGYEGTDVKFPSGYAAILDALQGGYELELSMPVARIALSGGVVTLHAQDGTTRGFDAVIVTVPLGVLKAGSIAFEPPLSAQKRGAIERMGMGLLDKLYLVFDRPFWDEQTNIITIDNGLPRGHFNSWLNLHRYFGVPVLVALHGGAPAHELATRSDEQLVTMALQTLRNAYPSG